MKKILNSVVVLILLALCLTACTKGKTTTTIKAADPDCLVWTTNGLEKIMRDDVYEREFTNLLSIELSQNEVEGGQIIITLRMFCPEGDSKALLIFSDHMPDYRI